MDADLNWPAEGGAIFKGSKGQIMCGVYAESAKLLPLSRHLEYKRPPKTLPRVADSHEMEWVRAIKEGRPANAGFDYSGPLTELCLLGNVAKRVDGPITWDAANLKVTNLPRPTVSSAPNTARAGSCRFTRCRYNDRLLATRVERPGVATSRRFRWQGIPPYEADAR